MKITLIIGLLFVITTLSAKETIVEKDFSKLFNGLDGTIVIFDQKTDQYTVYNKVRSTTRFTPFSTFKIPNSIIALETGTIKNIDTIFQWDTTMYRPESWWPAEWLGQKHNMRSAIEFSVVPFYREIATRVGKQRMSDYVTKFNYGNMDISSGVDNFWLGGSLSISAMEQIDFLRKFYNNKLGIKESATAAVKEILVREKGDGFTLSAKTGGGGGFLKSDPERALGWYVGYVEKGDNVFFFALNIEGKNGGETRQARIDITKSVLKEMGIIK